MEHRRNGGHQTSSLPKRRKILLDDRLTKSSTKTNICKDDIKHRPYYIFAIPQLPVDNYRYKPN